MQSRFLNLSVALFMLSAAPAVADDWPQWRGLKRDGVSNEVGLLKEWPEDGPKLKWKATDLGKGYSTPSIAKGQIYLIGTPDGKTEHVIALAEADGQKLWSTPIGGVGRNFGPQYPAPRSTPTVDGNRLYALSSDGDLVCLGAEKGDVIWKKSLRTDFDGQPGKWAYAESPLVDGDKVVCCPGGTKATMVALNKTTGETIWQCQVPKGDASAFSSTVVAEVGGIRQYIQLLGEGVVGVEAMSGRYLWRYDRTSNGATNSPTPIVHDGTVFSTAQKTGAGLVKLTVTGDKVTADEVYFVSQLRNYHGGVVRVGDYAYGASTSSLVCLDFKTGAVKWEDQSVGAGSVCYADGHLYFRAERGGAVVLVEANPAAYKEKSRFTPPESSKKEVWPHPVVANGCLYLRDAAKLNCYEVRGK